MRKLILFLLLVGWCGAAGATIGAQYYIDPTCAFNGNGLGMECAAGAGQAGAFNSCTTPNTFTLTNYLSADLAIYAGTTLNCELDLEFGGTAADYSEWTSYNKGYVNLPDAIIDGAVYGNYPWTQYLATAIYQTPGVTGINLLFTKNTNTRLRKIAWDTNIATTAADMVAGSYTRDTTGNILYVWAYNGLMPEVDKSVYDYGIESTGYDATHLYQYRHIHDLNFKRHSLMNLRGANFYSTMIGDGDIIHDNSFSSCGSACVHVGGDYLQFYSNDCSKSGFEGASDAACVVFDGGAGDADTHNIVGLDAHDNYVHDTVNGSCYEMNFGIQESFFHHNRGDRCTHQFLEIWDQSDSNHVYANSGDVTGYSACPRSGATPYTASQGDSCRVSQGIGIKIAEESSNNLIYNNKMKGFLSAGYATGAAGYCNNINNKFYNNTAINTDDADSFAGFQNSSTCTTDTGNEFKNSIVQAGSGGLVFSGNSSSVLDYNAYSMAGPAFAEVDGTVYTTPTAYLAANPTWDTHSVIASTAYTITSDAAATGSTTTNASSITKAYTIGTGIYNRLLVVVVGSEAATDADVHATGCTWNGDAMTEVTGGGRFYNGATADWVSMWYILNPDTGTHNVVCTLAAQATGIAVSMKSYYNVKQQAPEATAVQLSSTSQPATVAITTLSDNAIIRDVFATWDAGEDATPGTGQAVSDRRAQGLDIETSLKTTTTAGLTSMSWTKVTAGRDYGMIAAAWAPITYGSGSLLLDDNYYPLPGSINIDAGECLDDVTDDYRGKPRPYGSTCDAGAYEFWQGIDFSGVTLSGVGVN